MSTSFHLREFKRARRRQEPERHASITVDLSGQGREHWPSCTELKIAARRKWTVSNDIKISTLSSNYDDGANANDIEDRINGISTRSISLLLSANEIVSLDPESLGKVYPTIQLTELYLDNNSLKVGLYASLS